MMKKVIDRLKREPIASRVGLAAVLNVLVLAGVLDSAASSEVETAVLAVVNVCAILGARGRVYPTSKLAYVVERD